jgi:hypothetical protein
MTLFSAEERMKKFIVMNIDIQGNRREGEPPEYPKNMTWLYKDAPLGPRAWAEYGAVFEGQHICSIVDEKGDPVYDKHGLGRKRPTSKPANNKS